MPTYNVMLPITGKLYVEVEADDEDDAIQKALNADFTIENVEELEAHDMICQGNVFYGMANDAEAQLVGD